MKVQVRDEKNKVLAQAVGDEHVVLTYDQVYQPGHKLVFEGTAETNVCIEVDPHIATSIIYMKEDTFEYVLPQEAWKRTYHPETFAGNQHKITMSITNEEMKGRRNIALNGLDKRGPQNYYPHTNPNIVTRDEPWFEGKNAIDGYKDTKGHGPFPYQSWGGGLRDDLEFFIEFGRDVLVDEIILYLRADYKEDHDINWESGQIEFSDGSKLPIKMIKSTEGQSFKFLEKRIEWIKLNHLRREVSAAFSALIQIEVFGSEV